MKPKTPKQLDYGSRPWLYPALLSDAPSDTLRRGTQQDILRGLRRLLSGSTALSSPRRRQADGLTDRVAPSGGDSGRLTGGDAQTTASRAAYEHQPSGVPLGRRLVAARLGEVAR